MLVLDIETLGTESNSVILSAALTFYNSNQPLTYQQLLDNSIFVKFDVREQIQQYNRITDKDTLNWWDSQCDFARKRSLIPSPEDVSAKNGILLIKQWLSKIPNYKTMTIFTRGSLDQMCIDSLCKSIGVEKLVPYYNYRDVRTLLDCFYKTERGYCSIDKSKCPDFDINKVIKHCPVHDVCYDMVQILAGV
jgi:hypothetical protein